VFDGRSRDHGIASSELSVGSWSEVSQRRYILDAPTPIDVDAAAFHQQLMFVTMPISEELQALLDNLKIEPVEEDVRDLDWLQTLWNEEEEEENQKTTYPCA
jgi:hypothetical protein